MVVMMAEMRVDSMADLLDLKAPWWAGRKVVEMVVVRVVMMVGSRGAMKVETWVEKWAVVWAVMLALQKVVETADLLAETKTSRWDAMLADLLAAV